MAFFDFSERIAEASVKAEEKAKERFAALDDIGEFNQQKVLAAFINNGVTEPDFGATTGYGYADRGRDKLESIYAEVFGAQDAIVRHSFVSGTHTLAVALFGILRPGDIMLSVTGTPYDTIHGVIGISGEGMGSLRDFGIEYRQVDLYKRR